MAVFSANEVSDQLLDWTMLRDGGIALYWRAEILADELSWLESKGYKTVSFETSEWLSEGQMHDSLKANLAFPAYYGNNLNALNECVQEDLAIPDAGGLVLVLNRYDRFAEAVPGCKEGQRSTAEIVLDIFAGAVRYHMLFGHRLIVLVQSDDPRMQFGRLGGIAASWNRRDWLNKDRGI